MLNRKHVTFRITEEPASGVKTITAVADGLRAATTFHSFGSQNNVEKMATENCYRALHDELYGELRKLCEDMRESRYRQGLNGVNVNLQAYDEWTTLIARFHDLLKL